MIKKLCFLSGAVLVLLGGAQAQDSKNVQTAPSVEKTPASKTQTESERLNIWFAEQFKKDLERSPMSKTYLGIKDADYGKWDNASDDFEVESYHLSQKAAEDMRRLFDPQKLEGQARLSFRLYDDQAKHEKQSFPFHRHAYLFNQMYGAQAGAPAFMINQHSVDTLSDAEAYVARLDGLGTYLDQNTEEAKARFDMGIYPPRFVYDYVLQDARNIITGVPFDVSGEDNALWADFKAKLDKISLPEDQKNQLQDQAKTALLDKVRPAYERLITEMERQKGKAETKDGAWKLPDGEAYYQQRLKNITTTDMTADEIHALGLKEVARIHDEMQAIMKKTGFKGTLQEFFTFMREDPQFYYPNTEKGRVDYLQKATDYIESMEARLDEVLTLRPKAGLEVKRVEAFREKSAGKAFYQQPSRDGSRPGRYYANLYKMEEMPRYQMEALAFHEGSPGHHMQIAIAQELEGIPDFRKYGGYTAYIEGWGLYSEYFPKEMGFYEDPYSDFGRLAMELWRAARLVVDTGLHAKKWTREQATDYLVKNTPNPKGDCVKAIDRYIVMPGQATAYKIGMIKILELREKARKELGQQFRVQDFHDTVLKDGALPLSVLEDRVHAYIDDTKKGTKP